MLIAGALLFAADLSVLSTPVYAQSCSALQSQYAKLTRSIKAASKNRYSRAYLDQRSQLNAANAAYKQAGCRSLFGHSQNGACVQRRQRITAMESNLARLDRRAGGTTGALERQRAAVQAKLKRNRCGATRTASLAQNVQRATTQAHQARQRSSQKKAKGPTYRTLCVRACDGYYFPVSFSTTSKHFQTDLVRCQQMCPASQVDLYFHSNPGEGPEDMKSLSGLTYSSLDTAFLYRKTRVNNCSCRSLDRSVVSSVGGGIRSGEGQQLRDIPPGMRTGLTDLAPLSSGTPALPIPSSRLPADEDPETIANLRGDLDPSDLVSALPNAGDTDRSPKPVRIVGPKFFPDRSEVRVVPDPDRASGL